MAVVAVDGEEVLCTNVVKGSCDPYWDVHCDMYVFQTRNRRKPLTPSCSLATKDSVVTIKVRDHRNFKPRDPDNSAASLGTVSIRIGDVLDLADDSEQHSAAAFIEPARRAVLISLFRNAREAQAETVARRARRPW